MSVSIDDFVRAVEAVAPMELAEAYDNTGLLLRMRDTVSKVLIALDATDAVAQEAEETGCDMLLVHHPLIFAPFRALDCRKAQDAVLMRLMRADISLYAAHLTFDKAQGGLGDALAERIGLCDAAATQDGLMRIGRLGSPQPQADFLESVKNALKADSLCVSAVQEKPISRVAVVSGSGGDYATAAHHAGAQALVTGEAKHHHFVEAAHLGLLLIAAGHFETECLFADQIFIGLQARLHEVQLDLALEKSTRETAPYRYR